MSPSTPDRRRDHPVSAADDPALTGLLAKSAQKGRPEERLTDHLLATLRAAEAVLRRTGRIDAAEATFHDRFGATVALAALYHDVGKVPAGFQDMLVRLVRYGERHEVLSLGFLPWLIDDPALCLDVATAVVTHHRPLTDTAGRSITTLYGLDASSDFRDRFDRVPAHAVVALLEWLRATAEAAGLPVCHSPGPTENGAAQTGSGMPPVTSPTVGHQLADAAHDTLQQVLDRWEEPSDVDGLAAVLLQGAVTTADRLSSAHQDLHTEQPLGKGLPALVERQLAERAGGVLRAHQRDAGAVSGHLVLRAPTGSGKTEAVLLWASRQVQEIEAATGATPRVYYTLPYLASINAMTDRLADLIGTRDAVGVSHSRAASYYLSTSIAPEDGNDSSSTRQDRADAATRAVARAAATRLYRETVRVGTPYQLLRSALAGTTYSGVLLDTANSVFVLDELHAYDPQRLGYILASMALWNRLGGRVAVVSATLPQVLTDLLEGTLPGVAQLRASDAGPPARHRIGTREHHLTDATALREIRDRLQRGESVLVVANNVADAIELYGALAPAARRAWAAGQDHRSGGTTAAHPKHRSGEASTAPSERPALLLHSRFRRRDRNAIEREIRKRFGTEAERRGGLVVTTQVVEVSLDVDFDVLFTSAAPLEALLQRFGRVNRVGARPPADVIVHEPKWVERHGTVAGVCADGVYAQEPTAGAWLTLQKHRGKVVSEEDATEWLNDVYDSEWGNRWKQEVHDARQAFDEVYLSFRFPFDDREPLAGKFDEMFNGTEAIHSADVSAYRKELRQAPRAAGRLLADDLLIPLPEWSGKLARRDHALRVRVVAGDYDPEFGLRAVRAPGAASTYVLGEMP